MPLQEVSAGCDRPLQELADVIFNSHKVVVITGAGISTSCGIPVRLDCNEQPSLTDRMVGFQIEGRSL